MRLWDWAAAAYARRGVEAACLALQDEHGQSAPYLLWAAWAGVADAGVLARAADLARRWEAGVGAPLRTTRRTLKEPMAPVGEAARQVLREEVKAAELAAERVLLDTLEQLAPRGRAEDLPAVLAAACAAWGRPAPADALERLADALA